MNAKEARALRSFGKNIAALRRASGLTQEQLAERSDLAVATIASIEQGKRWARLTTLQRLANALRVTTAELLNRL
ncbi:helix-turn-helix domain-containing protein [Nocardia sp. R7R-8]|uniref:helix-turn-helix domain-containing protein n=1 Tax=Nocardia sp. R7R-8 TaxID=3459304 RepID=UPI00403DA838